MTFRKGNVFVPIVLLLLLLTAAHLPAKAQALDPRALALGGAYTTLARGADALHWNPANLKANPVRFELSLPGTFGLSGDNSYFSLNRVLLEPEDYASGDEFLADMTGGRLAGSARGGLFGGLNIGAFGLSARLQGATSASLSPDATRLFVTGTAPGATYTVTGSSFESYGLASAGGGFAFGVGGRDGGAQVSVGVNANVYRGLFYARADVSGAVDVSDLGEYTADMRINALHTDVDKVYGAGFSGLNDRGAGEGYGVDLGVTVQPRSKWTFGAAVNNVYSEMTWYDLQRIEGELQGQLIGSGDDGPEFPDDIDSLTNVTETDVAAYARALPMDVRVGASFRPSPKLVFAADVSASFAEGAPSQPVGFHVGVEATPFAEARFGRRLALRAGLESRDGQTYYSAGFGIAFLAWEFDAGLRLDDFQAADAQGTAFAVTSRLRF